MRQARAFTLVELLVVIGIIAILAGIALVFVPNAYRSARETQARANLQTVALALSVYQQDFGLLPVLANAQRAPGLDTAADAASPGYVYGSELLAWALVGPYPATGTAGTFNVGDGADGPGWRVRGVQGQERGPYVDVEKFRFAANGRYYQLLDSAGRPILYFPAHREPGLSVIGGNSVPTICDPAKGYAGKGANVRWDLRYDEAAFNDAVEPEDSTPAQREAKRLAAFRSVLRTPTGAVAYHMTGGSAVLDGPVIDAEFVLWGAGIDERFGTADDILVTP